jgi:hypothetical protein
MNYCTKRDIIETIKACGKVLALSVAVVFVFGVLASGIKHAADEAHYDKQREVQIEQRIERLEGLGGQDLK